MMKSSTVWGKFARITGTEWSIIFSILSKASFHCKFRNSTPPPIPKRVDSIAKNIDKYFDLKLVKRADEDEENAGERIEKQILNPSDAESDVSLEEASERQLVPFTEDERSIPDVGEFQEPEILDAFPAPPVNLPTKKGKFFTNNIFRRRKIMIPKFVQAPRKELKQKEILRKRRALPLSMVNTPEKLQNTALNSKFRIP